MRSSADFTFSSTSSKTASKTRERLPLKAARARRYVSAARAYSPRDSASRTAPGIPNTSSCRSIASSARAIFSRLSSIAKTSLKLSLALFHARDSRASNSAVAPNSPASSRPLRSTPLASSIASKHASTVGNSSAADIRVDARTASISASSLVAPLASSSRVRSPCAATRYALASNPSSVVVILASVARRARFSSHASTSSPAVARARSTSATASTPSNPSASSTRDESLARRASGALDDAPRVASRRRRRSASARARAPTSRASTSRHVVGSRVVMCGRYFASLARARARPRRATRRDATRARARRRSGSRARSRATRRRRRETRAR